MPTVRMPAFLVAPAESVVADHWLVRSGGEWTALASDFRSFDPAGTLEFSRRLLVDQHRIRTHCGLDSFCRIGVTALWSSTLTGLKGTAGTTELDPAEALPEVDLELEIAGGLVGGRLDLRTVLLLSRPAGERQPLVAHQPGSILWEDDPATRIDLEGSGTRFPTELSSFGRGNSFPPRAAWYLDWDRGDLSLPVLGSMRLYLNADHPQMAAIAEGRGDPETMRIQEALTFDIARQLLTGALANPQFLADPDGFPPESVGAVIRRLCRGVLFQYSSLGEVAARATRAPSRFEADLQAAISLYWGGRE